MNDEPLRSLATPQPSDLIAYYSLLMEWPQPALALRDAIRAHVNGAGVGDTEYGKNMNELAATLNVAAAPFPAPCPAPSLGKKIYAKPTVKKDRWSSEDCQKNQRTDSSCRRRLSGLIKTCEHREQKGPYKYRKPGTDSA